MPFPATRPSVIQRTSSHDSEVRARALDTVAAVYWRPIYLYIRLTHRVAPADAEDLTQGFFAEALRRSLFERFDPSRARFRTFVRACVDSYVANARQAEARIKRGGAVWHVGLDAEELERIVAVSPDVERAVHDEWVRAVFSASLARVRDDYAAAGKARQLEVFERYDIIGGDADSRPTYADIAVSLGVSTTQATNWLTAARRAFRSAVLETLRDLTGSDDEFRTEARALLGATVE